MDRACDWNEAGGGTATAVADQPDFSVASGLERAPNPLQSARVLSITCVHNEMGKLEAVLQRMAEVPEVDVLIVNDASNDGVESLLAERGVQSIRNERQRGVGCCIRQAIDYFLDRDYEIMTLVAGNNKDNPAELERLVAPIVADELDMVQGSRHLPGGQMGNTPFYRQLATRYVHPLLFSLVAGQWMTDTTNGFRAIHRRVLEQLRPSLEARWLDAYELEPYLLYKAIKEGFRVGEVPCTKIYPPRKLGYTKMKPISGWWSILRPLFLLGLGLKH